jgi:hypothetical protein
MVREIQREGVRRVSSREAKMGEIVNLNRARKAAAKTTAKASAEANRAAHGRTRAEKDAAEKERQRLSRLLDGKKLED